MKKFLTLAAILTLVVAGTAMAQDRLFIQQNATFAAGAPATTNNDDSCDIGNAPAATLLLPFFSVSLTDPNGENTLFTLTNTSQIPQIAHITIWTDWSFPVIDFNIFLTGYDVQGISLRDIIVNGTIPVTGMLLRAAGQASSQGVFSFVNTNNANFDATALAQCGTLPGPIPSTLRADIASALTTGDYGDCIEDVGGDNPTAQGYVTVDVADTCSQLLPTDPRFYDNDILWDNTLIGDWQLINIGGRYAGGETMVSIRAIPEGGNRTVGLIPGTATPFNAAPPTDLTNFPFTFYDRYTSGNPNREIDRRQPLPGIFAARFIEGGALGFDSDPMIWREGRFVGSTDPVTGFVDCDNFVSPMWSDNGILPVTTIVRFDEHENPSVSEAICQISPCPQIVGFVTEESARNDVGDTAFFPPAGTATADPGGWLYLNLNGGCQPLVGAEICSDDDNDGLDATGRNGDESQAWVVVNMAADANAFSVSFDAPWLQNGCTPNPGAASVPGETGTAGIIGPALAGTTQTLNSNSTPATP